MSELHVASLLMTANPAFALEALDYLRAGHGVYDTHDTEKLKAFVVPDRKQ